MSAAFRTRAEHLTNEKSANRRRCAHAQRERGRQLRRPLQTLLALLRLLFWLNLLSGLRADSPVGSSIALTVHLAGQDGRKCSGNNRARNSKRKRDCKRKDDGNWLHHFILQE